MAAKAGDLPALPVVAIRVINLTAHSQTSGEDLETEILRDQALVTRVLRLANSAAYGLRGTIATVSHAIFILGFDTVRSLVLAACAETLYRRGGNGFSDTVLWDHVRGAACLSRFLADHCGYAAGERAFIAGLVHDVGKVVMDRNLREMGAGDLGVGRRVKTMVTAFYGRVAAYEDGLSGDRLRLVDSLSRNLYRGGEIPQTTVAVMAEYVRREADSLRDIPLDSLLGGALSFGPPPRKDPALQ